MAREWTVASVLMIVVRAISGRVVYEGNCSGLSKRRCVLLGYFAQPALYVSIPSGPWSFSSDPSNVQELAARNLSW